MTEVLTVRNVHWYSDGIFGIAFERDGIEFVPGDCLALFGADEQTSRPYSVASGAGEDTLRFVIRRMPGGDISGYLAEREAGDRVKISPPFGWFRPGPRDDGSPFVFLATGTGISPFLAHFNSRPVAPPLQCLYGVRTLDDAVDSDKIESQCDLRMAVSRGDAGHHHRGRITDLLEGMPCATENHYYLCGLDAMIDDVSQWLELKGVPITHIHRECFFNASYSTPQT